MAVDPVAELLFDGACPDCGRRLIDLPDILPTVGDDFDWDQRDYDGFRLFMLQELAARFPERRRWTPADVEVALIEVLAYGLDQLSDALDRAASESFLETARRPESLRRLLLLIGYDVAGMAKRLRTPPFADLSELEALAPLSATETERFDRWWLDHPEQMEQARLDGPRAIHDQHRMVTLEDFERQLELHPLVLRAHAWERWDGSWTTVHVAVIAWQRLGLDVDHTVYSDEVWAQTQAFHAERDLALPARSDHPNVRSVLYPYIETYRMVGQEVVLEEAVEVGITLTLSIQVNDQYFQSEVRHAVDRALGTGPGGFFAPGRLRFGEDLWASDLYQLLMGLSGIDNICLNRFKRLGDRFQDETASGRIVLEGLEVAICDNDPARPERGYYRLMLHGGRKG
ncbi:hypothetical protein Despr_3264 [Desulfobulbus propionicus DSM 2032]|jgi:hypothetical protein|uniref:Baseplate protein J-like domain-containing protein n=1 Tax=Desulfobulbus propionicus (strain ATCC 33891 / DSM 2032 / VKM B-1956 / 1pr3) TaxID=577650 RepID=A0A7U4DQN6_DESPD|nr:hypothetical protein [Desulfobulbus propionicus]ADW19391.1 hypothetical protein Despr_3264 [Desulfobulbus propionicus DSM 2032]